MLRDPRQEFTKIVDLAQQGKFQAGYKKAAALAKKVSDPAIERLAGACAGAMEKHRLAASHYARAYKMAPADVETQDNLLQAMILDNQTANAEQFIKRHARDRAQSVRFHVLSALLFSRNDQFVRACDSVQIALELDPEDPKANELAAKLFVLENRSKDALAPLRRFVEAHPDNVKMRWRLATNLLGINQVEEARQHLDRVLALDPTNADTLRTLARITQAGDDTIATMIETLRDLRNAHSDDQTLDAMTLTFTLADLLFKSGEQEEAMQLYSDAKAKQHVIAPYDMERAQKTFHKVTALGAIAPTQGSKMTARPIFVIGQPRSGTTLTELILSAHSKVEGLGELSFTSNWCTQQAWTEQNLGASLRAYYCDRLPMLPEGTEAFVDKLPGNYAHVNLLSAAFPEAIFLNIMRDPRDVAFSMWRNPFFWQSLLYTNNLRDMAAQANLYRSYLNRWNDLLPGRVHSIRYEDIVQDIEAAAKNLAQLAGLDHQPAMVEPHLNTSEVVTLSQMQVRKPVTTSSIGGWKPFAHHLRTFIEGLDPALWPEYDLTS